jgi:hypothetical protein
LKTKPNRIEKKPEKNQAKLEKNQAKTEKTEPNRKTKPKPSQTGLNHFLSKKPNQIKTGRFEPVSVFKKKNRFDYFFLSKLNRTENNHS